MQDRKFLRGNIRSSEKLSTVFQGNLYLHLFYRLRGLQTGEGEEKNSCSCPESIPGRPAHGPEVGNYISIRAMTANSVSPTGHIFIDLIINIQFIYIEEIKGSPEGKAILVIIYIYIKAKVCLWLRLLVCFQVCTRLTL
jgi:hypothetical protein